MSVYTYSASADTLNGIVAVEALSNEIRAEAIITKALEGVALDGDVLTITFRETLPAGQQTELDNVVAAHPGQPDLDDAQKFTLVDANNNPIGSLDDNGTRRIAFDLGSALTGPEGPQGPEGPEGPQGPAGPPATFGSEYIAARDLATSSTTSTTPVLKLTLSATNLPAGTYRLGWSYNWSHSAANTDFEAQIRQGGVSGTVLHEHRQEPQDPGVDQLHPASGHIDDLALSGNVDFSITYNTDDPDDAAFIRGARLELWRVL